MKTFVVDAANFRKDWEDNGPMVPGLDPMDAVDRLKKFQQMFEVRKRKWENYSSGEELFGRIQLYMHSFSASGSYILFVHLISTLSFGLCLVGLGVTQYPELESTEKEVQMLDRLYTLYVTVITTIKGYGDYFWIDVVEQIEAMAEQVF